MKLAYTALIFTLLLSLAGCTPTATPAPTAAPTATYYPNSTWLASTPEEQGMDSAKLVEMFDRIQSTQLNLHSLLIIRNGKLITEAYFAPYDRYAVHGLQSVTKSVTSTLIGMAIDQGLIQDANQTVVSFFPERKIANLDTRKQSMTLANVLSMTSGIKCQDDPVTGKRMMEDSEDWVQFVLDSPMEAQPGTKFNYCTSAAQLLTGILQKVTGISAREFANQNLFAPLSIPAVNKNNWFADPQGNSTAGYGLFLTPRDMAKLGYLYMQGGQWKGRQILSKQWIEQTTQKHSTKDNGLGYGYLWTVDEGQDSYSALGLGGEQIFVIPKLNLVVVFTATLPSYGKDMDFLPGKGIVDTYIIPAAKSTTPLPASAASAQLQKVVEKLAQPDPQARPVPENFLSHSGDVYAMEENPFGWKTLSLDFKKEPGYAVITINDAPVNPSLPLDGRFNVQSGGNAAFPLAMRGQWDTNGSALLVRQCSVGIIDDRDNWLTLQGDEISVRYQLIVFGEQGVLRGKLVKK